MDAAEFPIHVPGCPRPGDPTYDLHPVITPGEQAIGIGVRVMAATALRRPLNWQKAAKAADPIRDGAR